MTAEQLTTITETETPAQKLANACRQFVTACEAEKQAAQVAVLRAMSEMVFEHEAQA